MSASTTTPDRPLSRRYYLRVAGVALGAPLLLAGRTAAGHDIDLEGSDVDVDRGSTERCPVYVRYEDDDERARRCFGPDGGFVEHEDEAKGEEERIDFDANGTVRRTYELDDDGDETVRVYDENGTLRYYGREEEDGDETERWYDANGTLRHSRREDEDGDETEKWYDASGRLVRREDDD